MRAQESAFHLSTQVASLIQTYLESTIQYSGFCFPSYRKRLPTRMSVKKRLAEGWQKLFQIQATLNQVCTSAGVVSPELEVQVELMR
mmetsp:Transcript_6403/g.10436  ORF Transcript_6403/g.10436 Transcript_6403/m.10436 type:complete len:87 (-) Transcript_6403:353-613(-)